MLDVFSALRAVCLHEEEHLQGEVESLLVGSLVVQPLLHAQAPSLLLPMADHVELLLGVAGHHAEGQLGVLPRVAVHRREVQDLESRHTRRPTQPVLTSRFPRTTLHSFFYAACLQLTTLLQLYCICWRHVGILYVQCFIKYSILCLFIVLYDV